MPRFQGIPVEQTGGRFGGVPVEAAQAPAVAPLSFPNNGFGQQSSNPADNTPFGYGTVGQANEMGQALRSRVQAGAEQFGQGLTSFLGDEVGDVLGSAVATPFTMGDKSLPQAFGDNLRFARGQTEARLGEQRNDFPATSTLANLAGGLALFGGLGGTGGGSQVGNFARAGSAPARAVKEGALGAITGAVGGTGMAEDSKKLEGAGTGALYGGLLSSAVPAATGALSALGSVVDEGAKPVLALAKKYGIPSSLAQASDSPFIKTVQKVSQEIPFSGEAGFRRNQQLAWQKNLLKTIGVEGDRVTPEIMDQAFTTVGQKFDDAIPDGPIKVKANFWRDTFNKKLDDIYKEAYATASPDALSKLQANIDYVRETIGAGGKLDGAKLRTLRSELNKRARKTDVQGAGDLIHQLEMEVIDAGTQGNQAAKDILKEAKQQYKNLIVIEPLAKKATKGKISAPELAGRVGQVYGRSYTRGKAGEIGDLARIGKELMPVMGGSDTAQKLALMGLGTGGAVGGAALLGIPTALGVLGANRLGQSLINRNPAALSVLSKLPTQSTGLFAQLPAR